MLITLEGAPDTGKTGFFEDLSGDKKILYVTLESKSIPRAIRKKHKVIQRTTRAEVESVLNDSIMNKDFPYDIIVVDPISRLMIDIEVELKAQGIKFTQNEHAILISSLARLANKSPIPVIFINHVYEDDSGKESGVATKGYAKIGGFFGDSEVVLRSEVIHDASDNDNLRYLELGVGKGRKPRDLDFGARRYIISGPTKEKENEANGITADKIINEIYDYVTWEPDDE